MNRFLIVSLSGLCALVVAVSSALARPDYNKQFQASFEKSPIGEAAKEKKCNVCHYGKTKKNRNDFGTALNKHLTADGYTELKSDKEALGAKIQEAFKAVMKEKSKSGKVFGELIEAGQLPGTAPEGEE